MNNGAVNRLLSTFEDLIRDRNTMIRIAVILLILLAACILRIHESSKSSVTIEQSDAISTVDEICVDIGGAVSKPGVYKIDPQTRLYEVIDMAGGLTADADTASINQAAYVEDGEKIVIPVRRAPEEGSYGGYTSGNDQYLYYDSDGLVNINTASKEELMTLSGIGEVIAERIIEYRTGSRFRSKEDIKSVKGIGDAVYESIKEDITV